MRKIESLQDIVNINGNFKTAINLYLNLNNPDKLMSYIPTNSSLSIMNEYLSSVLDNKEQATLLIGPYGKGKSHLLLVLLGLLSLERNPENKKVVDSLINSIKKVENLGPTVEKQIISIWNSKRFLPVLISDINGDLNQAFLYGLNEALKREKLSELVPDTFYSIALTRIADWEENYVNTYKAFENEIAKSNVTMTEIKADLKRFSRDALNLFVRVYPIVTSGSEFNPMAVSDVLPLYKSTSEKLVEYYGYSGIYIVFDEFSKYIESQNGNSVGANMKLLQDMCELATDSSNSQIHFTMVTHKSIKEYGNYLSQDIINSFTGIEGRLIEKYFVTTSKNNYELICNAIVKKEDSFKNMPYYDNYFGKDSLQKYYQLPVFKSNFVEKEFERVLFYGCFPLNPLASYLLLNISEKVAQNERTLFTFICNDEPHSLARYIDNHSKEDDWVVGADLIYDYFATLFKKEVSNEFVHNIWLSAEYAIGKCQNDNHKKIIKALAIILILNKEEELPANDKYLKLAVDISDAELAIEELYSRGFIYRKNSTGTYAFKTKAGSELKAEINRRREIKGDNVNYSKALLDVTGKYFVIPRKNNVKTMMTRYFINEFMKVEEFLSINSPDALLNNTFADGKTITLYGFETIDQEKIKIHFEKLGDSRIVVICPKQSINFKKQLKDYEIINEIRNDRTFIDNNEILKKELPLLADDLGLELENAVSDIYNNSELKVLYFDGTIARDVKAGNEEVAVNKCCELLYKFTPIINNEMVNRNTISTFQTKKARINIIDAILTHRDDERYYNGSNQEATVYRSLFMVTGIKTGTPRDDISRVLIEINSFIDSCCDKKGSFNDLIELLSQSPYGMRKGVVPFFVARVLADRREDIVIYYANKEIQITADLIIRMCEKPEDYSIYVSKSDLQKEQYLEKLNNLFQVEDNRNLGNNRISNIFICMQRWFRALPQATRNMVAFSDCVNDDKLKSHMQALKVLLQKVEYNSFECLFIDIPKITDSDCLEDAYDKLVICKATFDNYFDWLEKEVIKVINQTWSVKQNKELYHIIKEWYESQSSRSKQGLYDGRITAFISCVQSFKSYNNNQYIAEKIAKAVTDVYLEDWNNETFNYFSDQLEKLKVIIESIQDESSEGEYELSFKGKNGESISKIYSFASENSGSVLRNILEDALDEYDDLSVNDRVSILLEMIEKIIK